MTDSPVPPSGRALRVGTDIGGTFTDFVVLDPETGAITLEKRLTTPDDPARAVVDGVDALSSYADGEHERQVARIVRECRPDLWVSLSSEVLPEVREYERTSTTVANAYVRPLLSGYLRRLGSALDDRGFAGGFHVMQSTGGVVPLEVARTFPVRVVEMNRDRKSVV